MPHSPHLATALEAARAAADIVRHYYRSNLAITIKADKSPVTEADVETERTIRSVIAARHPGHGFYGEETGASDIDAEFVCIVYPIDGTKAFVREAYDDPRVVRAYATRTGLAGHTKNSITELAKLERELSMVRTRGYARDNEELELGVRCLAAGIRDDTGRVTAGLSVSAPSERMQDDWIDDLLSTAQRISAGLGYSGQPEPRAKS